MKPPKMICKCGHTKRWHGGGEGPRICFGHVPGNPPPPDAKLTPMCECRGFQESQQP